MSDELEPTDAGTINRVLKEAKDRALLEVLKITDPDVIKSEYEQD